jgi:hypothetical protein
VALRTQRHDSGRGGAGIRCVPWAYKRASEWRRALRAYRSSAVKPEAHATRRKSTVPVSNHWPWLSLHTRARRVDSALDPS